MRSPCTCCAPPHQFMWQALQLSTRYTICLSLVITFHRVNCTVYMGRQWVAQPNAYEAPPVLNICSVVGSPSRPQLESRAQTTHYQPTLACEGCASPLAHF